jgi:hypothetical protein
MRQIKYFIHRDRSRPQDGVDLAGLCRAFRSNCGIGPLKRPCRRKSSSIRLNLWKKELRHESFLHCFIALQHNRQLQLKRRTLLFNTFHEAAHILADQWRIVVCQRHKAHFKMNL